MKGKNIIINREVSWLHFNARVLQEAADENNPLVERIRFLGIFSNNRDEFYRVRVAAVKRMQAFKQTDELGFIPDEILTQINTLVSQQQEAFTKIYESLIHQLAEKDICLINEDEMDASQQHFVRTYFHDHIRSHIFPIMLKNINIFTALRDKSIYLAVRLIPVNSEKPDNYALVKIPSTVNRFVILPKKNNKKYIIIVDDVIRFCLDDIFSIFGYKNYQAYTIKFTRDAELDVDSDVSKSFLELMSESLKQRRMGTPLRFVYDRNIPEILLQLIMKSIGITKNDDLIGGGRYHNFKDFISFPNLGQEDLEFSALPPLDHPDLSYKKSILDVIRNKDVLLHYPYQSFQYIIDFLREVSIDPKVRSIKMTLYRVANQSKVVNALINAARNGKSVTVFMELQARFDEKINIYYAEKLQEEGVKIIQSIPGFKVHAKLILIKRRQGRKTEYFANVSTGNFNEHTSNLYTDICLLTANKQIAAEAGKTFELFESNYKPFRFSKLIVSPFNTRKRFVSFLKREKKNALEGKEAWAIIKLNNLVDHALVKSIVEAAEAGVKIKLIVRGICVLAPSEKEKINRNIEIISILDQFLEHYRLFIFCNGGEEAYFISSADWMARNLDNRIEVTCPIDDPDNRKELMDIIQIQLNDNIKARYIDYEGKNRYKSTDERDPIRSQIATYNYFREKLNKKNS